MPRDIHKSLDEDILKFTLAHWLNQEMLAIVGLNRMMVLFCFTSQFDCLKPDLSFDLIADKTRKLALTIYKYVVLRPFIIV